MSTPTPSWILEVRQRLEAPLPQAQPAAEQRLVVLLSLFVEEGGLWILVTTHHGAEDEPARLGLPGVPLAPDELPWAAVARVAGGLAIEPARVLRLGELGGERGLDGSSIHACVAAVPTPGATASDAGTAGRFRLPAGIAALPLVALEAAGERGMTVGDEERWFPVFVARGAAAGALAGSEAWGPPASILANLRRSLGMQ